MYKYKKGQKKLKYPYIVLSLEAVQLGDLLRIWVRSGVRIPRIFKGRRERTGHRGKRGALRDVDAYLRRLLVRLCYRTGPPLGGRSPRPGSGILTRFPFDRAGRRVGRHLIRKGSRQTIHCPRLVMEFPWVSLRAD